MLAALEHGKIEENSVNSGVFKGLRRQGNWKHCKHDVLERFYGDKCPNYRALKESIANADDGAKCRLDSFSGHCCCGTLKCPSLGGPHAGEKIKKHPLGGSQGGGKS